MSCLVALLIIHELMYGWFKTKFIDYDILKDSNAILDDPNADKDDFKILIRSKKW